MLCVIPNKLLILTAEGLNIGPSYFIEYQTICTKSSILLCCDIKRLEWNYAEFGQGGCRMYKLISVSSVFIRQFLLPNPFAAFQLGELYNWVATALLLPITFTVVSLFYRRGSAPALGSFLFLVFYMIHTGILLLCSVFSFNVIACVVIGTVYFAALIGGVTLKNRVSLGF